MALETLTTTSATSTSTSDGDGTNASTNDSLFGGPGGLAPAPLIPAFLFTGLLVAAILALMGYRKIMRNRAIERARLLGLYDIPVEPAEKKIPEIFDAYTAVCGQKSWRTLKVCSVPLSLLASTSVAGLLRTSHLHFLRLVAEALKDRGGNNQGFAFVDRCYRRRGWPLEA